MTLAPGETRAVKLPLPVRALRYWNTDRHQWVLEADSVRLSVGGSSTDSRVSTTIAVRPR